MTNSVLGTKKGTIFCIHGNSSSSIVYQELLNSVDLPYSKISIDLPGHGKNQSKNSKIIDFNFESCKKTLLDALSKIDDDVILIGNSLGGHLAIEIANDIKNLKGLVIMGTPPVKKPINFEEAFIPVAALTTFFSEHPKDEEIKEAAKVALSNNSNTQLFLNDFKTTNPLVRKAIAIDITENKLINEFEIFTTLDIPKYIIAGKSDPSVNRNYLEYVKNECKNRCTIFDLENCGHYPSLDRPNKFVEIINSICKEVF